MDDGDCGTIRYATAFYLIKDDVYLRGAGYRKPPLVIEVLGGVLMFFFFFFSFSFSLFPLFSYAILFSGRMGRTDGAGNGGRRMAGLFELDLSDFNDRYDVNDDYFFFERRYDNNIGRRETDGLDEIRWAGARLGVLGLWRWV
jgi:hypothetical protein